MFCLGTFGSSAWGVCLLLTVKCSEKKVLFKH